MRTGTGRSRWISRHTSRPSRPGSIRSRTTRSGRSRSHASTPPGRRPRSRPRSPRCAGGWRRRRRSVASSSTTRIVRVERRRERTRGSRWTHRLGKGCRGVLPELWRFGADRRDHATGRSAASTRRTIVDADGVARPRERRRSTAAPRRRGAPRSPESARPSSCDLDPGMVAAERRGPSPRRDRRRRCRDRRSRLGPDRESARRRARAITFQPRKRATNSVAGRRQTSAGRRPARRVPRASRDPIGERERLVVVVGDEERS